MFHWKSYLPAIRSALEDFTQEVTNSECFAKHDSFYKQSINEQKEKLLAVFESFDTQSEADAIEEYLDFCIHNDLPYLFVHSELSNIARELLGLLASEGKCSTINYANTYFSNLESRIAEEYYKQFLRKLATKHHIRLSHLSHLIEKHLMIHYQHHLEWMLVLIAQLQGTARDGSYCELDHTQRLFEKIVMGQIEIAKATESDCSMIMCDLDHFKEINDRFGHLSGDEVIKNFAPLLQKSLRKSDFIFRFGGEEFLILLPSTNYKEAHQLAETICHKSAVQKINYENNEIAYTVSIGVCDVDTRDLSFVTKETIQKYVHTVDAKLYLAKQNGRNRVE